MTNGLPGWALIIREIVSEAKKGKSQAEKAKTSDNKDRDTSENP